MNANLVEPIEFADATPGAMRRDDGQPIVKRDMAVLGHVAVRLEVVVGCAVTTVGELFTLVEGSTLKLDAELDAPVVLQLDGKAIARGHLVAVGDHFGIKIVEIA